MAAPILKSSCYVIIDYAFFLILTLVCMCVCDTHVCACLCTSYMLYMCVFVK